MNAKFLPSMFRNKKGITPFIPVYTQ